MNDRKSSRPGPPVAPKEHPRAWNSELWDHVETIRTLRRSRKSWKQIGEILEQEHGLKLAYRTIRNFYVRYTKRLKADKLPAGYEPVAPAPTAPARAPEPGISVLERFRQGKPGNQTTTNNPTESGIIE